MAPSQTEVNGLSLPEGNADKVSVEAVVNGYVVEIHYPDKIEKLIAWSPRVMIYIIAGLFGYDVQQLELTDRVLKDSGVKTSL